MEFQRLFPSADDVLGLTPEELGARMLPFLAVDQERRGLDPGDLASRIAGDGMAFLAAACYPIEHRAKIAEAVYAAWEWLQREGLVGEARQGAGGFRWRLSDRGRRIASSKHPLHAVRNGRVEILAPPGVVVDALVRAAAVHDFDTVQREVARALLSVMDDPEDATTAACSVIEAVCRSILVELGVGLPDKKDVDGLMGATQAALGLLPGRQDPTTAIGRDLRQLLGGLTTTAKGVGALRTHGGDAHGRESGFERMHVRTARLAINSAATVALFLVETWHDVHGRALPNHDRTRDTSVGSDRPLSVSASNPV